MYHAPLPIGGMLGYNAKKTCHLLFKGGYFNGAEAEKIDRPNKFFLVFLANPDNRWTCSYDDK